MRHPLDDIDQPNPYIEEMDAHPELSPEEAIDRVERRAVEGMPNMVPTHLVLEEIRKHPGMKAPEAARRVADRLQKESE